MRVFSIFLLCLLYGCNFCDNEDRRIIKAARNGDLQTIKEYLDNEGDPNIVCYDPKAGRLGMDHDLRYTAANSGNLQLVTALVETGKYSKKDLDSMLYTTLYNGHTSISKYLLSQNPEYTFNPKTTHKFFSGSMYLEDANLHNIWRFWMTWELIIQHISIF
ncbi:ankyrin repeat domain-containing protein [Zooshikella ganghwensis]|uniref:Ankyrin repeat domain-containing protein n=1 Tax=Zooshikella ganghwensis TaxID=202772 RepID=A0A4P9VEQ4_9GAMM|nr:hypothetical protein B9G39_28365 [Zooshikella ganghwensis]